MLLSDHKVNYGLTRLNFWGKNYILRPEKKIMWKGFTGVITLKYLRLSSHWFDAGLGQFNGQYSRDYGNQNVKFSYLNFIPFALHNLNFTPFALHYSLIQALTIIDINIHIVRNAISFYLTNKLQGSSGVA